MTAYLPDSEGGDALAESRIIARKAKPVSVPAEVAGQQQAATRSFMGRLWDLVKDRIPGYVEHLVKESLRKIKVGNDVKEAKAAKDFAKKDRIKQQTAIEGMRAQVEFEKRAESEDRILEAIDRLTDAISRMEQQGGSVAFNMDDLRRLLGLDADDLDDDHPLDQG